MTFLPIVDRELRAAARKPATYRLRLLGALMGVGVIAWRLFSMDPIVQSQQGRALFLLLITLAFTYCLFSGMALTADCLSQEKRDGTLGFLFLTNLKSHDLILGKLAANSIGAAYGLLAILPVLAITLTFGGVTGAEYLRAAFMLTNTLFISLAVGMLMSAICHHERKAFVGSFFVIFMSIAGPILLTIIATEWFHPSSLYQAAAGLLISPIFAFLSIRIPSLPIPHSFFWGSLVFNHIVGWTLLYVAGRIQQSNWQDKPKTEKRVNWNSLLHAFVYGSSETRTLFRKRMLDRQPLLWLNARNRLKPATVWFFLFCMGLLWIWDCSQLGSFMWEADHCLFAVFLLHSIIKIWIGVESCGRFADDQRTGAMELLLTAPTSEHEFFEAHKLAIKRQFALPVVAVLAFDLFVLANVMPAQGFWKTRWLESLPDIRLIFVAIMILLVIDILAICWVGVWEGIFAKSANRALGITLAKVLVMPSFVFLCSQGFFLGFINFLGVNFFGVLAPQSTRMRLSILLWIVTGLTFSLILRKRALAALREKFRVIASERYQGKASDPKSGPPTPTVLTVPHASTANR